MQRNLTCRRFIIIQWYIISSDLIGIVVFPVSSWCLHGGNARNSYGASIKFVMKKALAQGKEYAFVWHGWLWQFRFWTFQYLDHWLVLFIASIWHSAHLHNGNSRSQSDFLSNYYATTLYKDHIRVSNKFDLAACNGLNIQKRTVDNRNLLEHLSKNGPVIVLTNGNLLHCELCKTKESECLEEFRWGVISNIVQFPYVHR